MTEFKHTIHKYIVDEVDHKHLNYDVPWQEDYIPTTEILVVKFWERLEAALPKGLLYEVKPYETENNVASYRGEL